MPKQETTLGCAGAVIVAAILGGFGYSMLRRTADAGEADRMRRVYVALATYEQMNDERPAPDLLAARFSAGSDDDFVSARDPYGKTPATAFPNDGSLPDGTRKSSFRISFAYLWAFRKAGFAKTGRWVETRADPRIGLIASEWAGASRATGDFHAEVSGPVLRIGTDGALLKTSSRSGPKPLGDVQDLFFGK